VETINNGYPIYVFPVGTDTVAFSDYNFKAVFERDEKGSVTGLKMLHQDKAMPKMAADEYLPNELMRLNRYEEAVAGYRKMKLNEYQLSYMAYDFLHQKPAQLNQAEAILNLAREDYPQSAIVYARFGDLYQQQNRKLEAKAAYEKTLQLNPEDAETKEKLQQLNNQITK
jgi:tetratricopeptide (TPR) repeat protein